MTEAEREEGKEEKGRGKRWNPAHPVSVLFTRNSFHDNCGNRVGPRDASYVETRLDCLFTCDCTRGRYLNLPRSREYNICGRNGTTDDGKREGGVMEKRVATRLHPAGFPCVEDPTSGRARTLQNSTLRNATLEPRPRGWKSIRTSRNRLKRCFPRVNSVGRIWWIRRGLVE